MAVPSSTYRLQVRSSFDLYAAADICDYLATLGVGAVYLSPLLPAVRGSDHGYDVVGFDHIDPARGGLDGWTRLLAAARARGLGVIVDIVPNHTGVAVPRENPAWWDLLRLGRDSPYAAWFDVDWTDGRIRLPVLGDEFEPSQLQVEDGELRYFEHRFPLAPGTADGTASQVHSRQHYELVNYRRADTEQNYRRFFAVTTLAGLRVEDEDVFAATHEQIARWLDNNRIDGVRVDHPDGLADPLGYLARLRALAGPDAWITVEKILEPGERLPLDWPVDGTTGYDALAEVGGLFIDPSAEAELQAAYRELTGDHRSFSDHVSAGKRDVIETILQAELLRLARLVPELPDAVVALTELLVAFPVYRSYLPRHGVEQLAAAVLTASAGRPDLADTIGQIAARISAQSGELRVRFEQLSGAVMAKGVEDTAYYRHTQFIALNEVGGDPARFGVGPEDFHTAQGLRQRDSPRSMTTLSTHDTKRGEDVRAHLAVLSEVPQEWAALARELMHAAPLPDRTFAYLLWQTFVGTASAAGGFIDRERMHAYARKAMREAAISTGWLDPDTGFEESVAGLIDRAYDDSVLHAPLSAFAARIRPYGWLNSLSQKFVQLTMPGVPDVYQGTAYWEDSLVDPDNRRPMDFASGRAAIDRLDSSMQTPPIDATGAAKLWVLSRTLRLRREWPDLFCRYRPIRASGSAAGHAVAFDRGGAIAVATRLPVRLALSGGWGDTSIDVGHVTNVISGLRFSGPVPLAELLADYPVALLVP